MSSERTKIIFFGNGVLSEYALRILERDFEIVFHAKTREDLKRVCELKRENPEIHGILCDDFGKGG